METNQPAQPIQLFSHVFNAPGVPTTSILSSVGLLLGAYGVTHDIPIDPSFSSESFTSGNKDTDDRIMYDYMTFKSMIESFSREFTTVQCQTKCNGWSVHMKFSCY